MQESLLQGQPEGFEAPPPAAGSMAPPVAGFRTHTATLFAKNWQLKKRQWWTACCCFKGWCPCAGFCEVVFPLLVCLPLVFAKYKCGDTCVSFTVGGWGGNIPQPVITAGATACQDQTYGDKNNGHLPGGESFPDEYSDTKMTCHSWAGSTMQVPVAQ